MIETKEPSSSRAKTYLFVTKRATQYVVCLCPVLICVFFVCLLVGLFIHSFVALFGVCLSLCFLACLLACLFLIIGKIIFASDRLSALMEASSRAVSSVMRLSWSNSLALVLCDVFMTFWDAFFRSWRISTHGKSTCVRLMVYYSKPCLPLNPFTSFRFTPLVPQPIDELRAVEVLFQ